MFADRMEWRNRFDVAAKQAYLETLMQQTRDLAGKNGDVKDDYLDALDAWLKALQPWLVAGPFPADGGMDRPLSPETSIDPDARYQGADSSDISWHIVSVRPCNTVDLQRLYPGSDEVVAYAATYIHSAENQSVTLRFAGRDFVKVWLGDKVILQTRLGGPEGAVKVTVPMGANRLLIKSIDRPVIDWGFEVSALDDNGWPAPVTWSSDADPALGPPERLHTECGISWC